MTKRETTRSDETSYNAKYPMNQVMTTPAGHQIQVDNTPGHERIFIQSSGGTFMEWSADGKSQSVVVGDQKTVNKGGVTLTIDENNDVKISGHNRMMVGGGAHIEVAGDAGVMVGGNMAAAVMGALNARCKKAYVGADGDVNMNAGGNINIKAKGKFTVKASSIHLN